MKRPARMSCVGLILMFLAAVSPAGARTLIVKPDGSGDVPTIQAGVDTPAPETGDTLLIEPGSYAERVVLPQNVNYNVLVCPAGPESTSLAKLFGPGSLRVCSGLAFSDSVDLRGCGPEFTNCRFLRFLRHDGSCGAGRFTASEFRGVAAFLDYAGTPVVGCHFIDARVLASAGSGGDFSFLDCTFEGPLADTTAILAQSSDGFGFLHCSFNGSRVAIAGTGSQSAETRIENCTFEDISGDAIWIPSTRPYTVNETAMRISGSRFTRCGSAVHIDAPDGYGLAMAGDTIEACSGDGIHASALVRLSLRRVAIRDGDGAGARFGLIEGRLGGGFRYAPQASIDSCAFDRNHGPGLALDDGAEITNVVTFNSGIHASEAVGNGAEGITLRWRAPRLSNLLVTRNQGDGLSVVITRLNEFASLDSITSAYNAGNGVIASCDSTCDFRVQHVLSAFNGGHGFILPLRTLAAGNDAWQNPGGNYVNASPDSNLVTDPLFCDAAAGDFHVDAESPCAPSGPYGRLASSAPAAMC